MSVVPAHQADPPLNRAISDAMVELYATFYQHDRHHLHQRQHRRLRTREHPYRWEDTLIAEGAGGEVIDGRVAFQTNSEDEFTATI